MDESLTEDDKILPKDFDSDSSLPGRFEEGNSEFDVDDSLPDIFEDNTKFDDPKPKNKIFLVIVVAFGIISLGFFSYYFMNQDDIDSQIIQNTIDIDPEKKLVNKYNVGEFGGDHAHAAIAVFVDDVQINFGLPQFHLTSKYIHFENGNKYLIHRHATGVPLDMLFASFGMKITSDCVILNYGKSADNNKFCSGQDQSLVFYVNGEEYYSDISQYVLEHNDRILVSFGDGESISKYLAYLESLKIFDVPRTPQNSGNEIII